MTRLTDEEWEKEVERVKRRMEQAHAERIRYAPLAIRKRWLRRFGSSATARSRKAMHIRRKRILENGGKHTKADIEKMRVQQTSCVICNISLATSFHVDHIIPIALGGSNGPENLQLLCPRCNRKKGIKVHKIERVA